MREGLRSGIFSPDREKAKFSPGKKKKGTDMKQHKCFDLNDEATDTESMEATEEIDESENLECSREEGLNSNDRKRSRLDYEENHDDVSANKRLKEDEEDGDLQNVSRVLRSNTNRGTPPKAQKNDESHGDAREEVNDSCDTVLKVLDSDQSEAEEMKKPKPRRGRPPKAQKNDQSDGKARKDSAHSPLKVLESDPLEVEEKKKPRRGRPPKAQKNYEPDGDDREEMNDTSDRPSKVLESDQPEDEEKKKPKVGRGRALKAQMSVESDGEGREDMTDNCDRPSEVLDSGQSEDVDKNRPKVKRGRPPKVQKRDESDGQGKCVIPSKVPDSDQSAGEVIKKSKVKLGRPPKVKKSDESNGVDGEKMKDKGNRPSKVLDSDQSEYEEKKKFKVKRGRAPKGQKHDASDGEGGDKMKVECDRLSKVPASDQSNGEERKKLKRKRGRPPKVQKSDESDGEGRKKVKYEHVRLSKVQQSDELKGKERKKPKLGRPPKVPKTGEDNGEGRKKVTCKRGRAHNKLLDSDESDDEGRKRLKGNCVEPLQVQGGNWVMNAKLSREEKINGFTKSGMDLDESHVEKELNAKRFAPAENTKCGVKGEKMPKERSKLKQLMRDRIIELLLAAGWTIEHRPRNGRKYEDAVYVSPEGRTNWSVTKAYKFLKKHYEGGGENASTSDPGFVFTPIPEDELTILTKKLQKTRSDKNKKKRKRQEKDVTDDTGHEKDVADDEAVNKNMKRKQKLQKKKGNLAASGGGKSLKGGVKGKTSLCEHDNSVGKSQKGKTARNRKQQETFKRRRGALLARNSVKGAESNCDGYVPYDGKRTVLTWMIELGTVPLNAKVQYLNRRKTRVMLKGMITRDGICCDCCGEIFSISKFEAHAGSTLCHPFQNTYLESGTSLLQCILDSWNKQEECERKGFHLVDVGGEDPNDDTCGICGDGGDLICCDGCPSTFHQNCLDIDKFPSGKWHCVFCLCKYCGIIGEDPCQMGDKEDSVASALLVCSLCEEKYHQSCIQAGDAINEDPASPSFCGVKCREIFERLQMLLGVKYELEDGYTWTLIHRSEVGSDLYLRDVRQKVDCNAKLAVALSVMDECFLPLPDHRSGVNLIHNIVYNFGSNFNRLNYSGFLTAILERDDEIISVASIRIHGNELAEMPFIGTRNMYRRQGMCRRLLNGIESALCALNVEKLVIPAIAQLRETWTSVFGFKPVETSSEGKMRNMNLVVFPGVDMLQKPILKHLFPKEFMIPVGGFKSSELEKTETMDEAASDSDAKCSYEFDLNVCNEDTASHGCKINDESASVESRLQLHDGFSHEVSGVRIEPEITIDTKCVDQLGVTCDDMQGNDKTVMNPLGATIEPESTMDTKCVDQLGVTCDDVERNDKTVTNPLGVTNKSKSTIDTKGIDDKLGVTCDDLQGNDKTVMYTFDSACDADEQSQEISDSGGQFPQASGLGTEGIATEVKIDGIVKHMYSCDEASEYQSAEINNTEYQSLDLLQGLKVSSENVDIHDLEVKNQTSQDAKVNKDHDSLQLQVLGYIYESGKRMFDSHEVKSYLASGDMYRSSTESCSIDIHPKTGKVSSCSVHQTSPSTAQNTANTVAANPTEEPISLNGNLIPDSVEMITDSSNHLGSHSHIPRASDALQS